MSAGVAISSLPPYLPVATTFEVLLADGPHAGKRVAIESSWGRSGLNFHVTERGAICRYQYKNAGCGSTCTAYELTFMAPGVPVDYERFVLSKQTLHGARAIAWQVPEAPPTRTLPVLAWRAWGAARGEPDGDMMLNSANGVPWPHNGPLVAECRYRSSLGTLGLLKPGEIHRSPDEGCGQCGIYCVKSLSDLFGQWAARRPYEVYGLVAIWGKILEATGGYRAERAYPLAMFVVRPSDEWVEGDAPPARSEAIAALLTKRYRRWAFPIAPQQTYDAVVMFLKRGWLPAWAMDVLPPDVRFYVKDYRDKKREEWGVT